MKERTISGTHHYGGGTDSGLPPVHGSGGGSCFLSFEIFRTVPRLSFLVSWGMRRVSFGRPKNKGNLSDSK